MKTKMFVTLVLGVFLFSSSWVLGQGANTINQLEDEVNSLRVKVEQLEPFHIAE